MCLGCIIHSEVPCSLPSCFKMKLRILKGSRICLPNVPLWQNNYFELKATKLKAVENRYRKSFLPFLNLPKTDVSNHGPKLRFNCSSLKNQCQTEYDRFFLFYTKRQKNDALSTSKPQTPQLSIIFIRLLQIIVNNDKILLLSITLYSSEAVI